MPSKPLPTPIPIHRATTTIPHSISGAVGSITHSININWGIVGIGVVVLLVLVIIIFYLRGKLSSKTKCDLYMLEVDESKKTIELKCVEKLHGNVYVMFGDTPSFLVLDDDSNVYTIKVDGKKYRGVLAYTYGILSIPLDPDLVSVIHLFSKTNKYVDIDDKSVDTIISSIYSLSKKVNGKVVVADSIKLDVEFKMHKIMSDLLRRVLMKAQTSVSHVYSIMKQSEVFSKFVMALTKYRESRYGWLKHLITLVIVIGVLVLIISMIHH